MKTEPNICDRAGVRRGRAGVVTVFHGLETRMFPHFCMFRRGRRGGPRPFLENKEYRSRKKNKKERNKKKTTADPGDPGDPGEAPVYAGLRAGVAVLTPARPRRDAIKPTQNRSNVKRQTLKSRLLNTQCRSTQRGQHCRAGKSLESTNTKAKVKHPTPACKGNS